MLIKRIKNLLAWSLYSPSEKLPDKIVYTINESKQPKLAQIVKRESEINEFLKNNFKEQ